MKELKTIRGETMIVDNEDTQRNFPVLTSEGRNELLNGSRKKKNKKRTKSSKCIGVSSRPNNMWFSFIKHNGKVHSLGGLYYSEEDAAYIYDINALELRGENANRNFPNLSKEELTKKVTEIKIHKEKIKAITTNPVRLSKLSQGRTNQKSKKSKYIGVSFNKNVKNNKWKTSIRHLRKTYFLGFYKTEEDAAKAYDKKALELYGNDANRNFPNLTIDKFEDIKFIPYEHTSKIKQGKSTRVETTSKYIGVCKDKRRKIDKQWFAHITHKNKIYRLGSYYTEEDAAKAYDKKALELFGKDAKLNFPNLPMEELDKVEYIPWDNLSKNATIGQQGISPDIPKTSQYVGVCWCKRPKKWKASIGQFNEQYLLGYYINEEDAAKAYDKIAIELYGEKCKLNFPESSLIEFKENLSIFEINNKSTNGLQNLKIEQGRKRISIERTKTKTSQYIGVHFSKKINSPKKWTAQIYYLGKIKHIGRFYTEEDAAKAYDQKAIELFGEDVRRNFPNLTEEELSKKVTEIKIQKEKRKAKNRLKKV